MANPLYMKKIGFLLFLGLYLIATPLFAEKQWGVLLVPTANLYQLPIASAQMVQLTPSMDIVEILDKVDGFTLVRSDVYTGWILTPLLSDLSLIPWLEPSPNTLSPPPIIVAAPVKAPPPPPPAKTKPRQLDLAFDGFYEYKFSSSDYNPKIASGNIWNTIINDPAYAKLPKNVLPGRDRQDISYKLSTEGRVDDHLSLFYDIEQYPDFPQKIDIRVKYDRTELTFGRSDVVIRTPDFMNITQSLEGVKLTSYDTRWEALLAQGKEKSEPKKYENVGNGNNKVKLANKSLLEGSVSVFVNNQPQQDGIDYTVNYFEGEITFTTPKTQDQLIKILYEFTNPIEDFLPILSRKNFFGFQYSQKNTIKETVTKLTRKYTEVLWRSGTGSPPAEFRLEHTPLLLGSESVSLNNTLLKKDRDYFLNTTTGKLTLQEKSLVAQDTLSVSYIYYPTDKFQETILPDNTQGPFALSNSLMVPGSVEVLLDGKPVLETRDYTLDYESGKLYFNYPVYQIQRLSVSYTAFSTTVTTTNATNYPVDFTVSYANEHASASDHSLTTTITNESPTVSQNRLITAFNPISASSDMQVIMNSVLIPSSSYTVDYYRGTITFAGPITASSIAVNYTYKKSYQSFFIFKGVTGYSNQYYSSEVHFEIPNNPVKQSGIQEVTLWGTGIDNQILLVENQDYQVAYNDERPYLQIRFLTTADNPLSRLRQYPDANTNIKVKYLYTPDFTPDQGNVDQKVVDLVVKAAITPDWIIKSEIAIAKNNFSKPRKDGNTTFSGTGLDNSKYQLTARNLAENSESIFINGVLQTRDKNYYISYEQGTIKFRNLTPGPSDTIRVVYQFFDNASAEAGAEKTTMAYKVGTTYQTGNITLFSDLKKIDAEFIPIGEIKDAKGTLAVGGGATWQLSGSDSLFVDYHRRQLLKGKDEDSQNIYLNQDELRSYLNMTVFDGLVQTKQGLTYLNETQKSTSLTTANAYDVDSITSGYEGQAIVGPDQFQTTVTGRVSKKTSDYIDQIDKTDNTVSAFELNAKLTPTVEFVKKVSVNPYYSQADSKVAVNNTLTSSRNLRTYGVKTDIVPFDTLSSRIEYENKMIFSVPTGSTTTDPTLQNLRNIYTDISYRPYYFLDLGYAFTQGEDESILIGQTGRKSHLTDYRIKKLSTYEALLSSNLMSKELLTPLKGSYFSYTNTLSDTRENKDKITFNRYFNRYDYKNFTPISGLTIDTMGYENSNSQSLNLAETTISSGNATLYEAFRKDISGSIKPTSPILNLFTYTMSLSEKNEESISVQSAATTSNISTRTTPEFSRLQKLTFRPDTVPLSFINPNFVLTNTALSVEEKRADKTDLQQKIDFSNTTLYSLLTIQVDESKLQTHIYEMSTTPLNMIQLTEKISDSTEYYNRNLSAGATGSVSLFTNNQKLTAIYEPWQNMVLTGTYQTRDFRQAKSPTINISQEALSTNFSEKLNESESIKGVNAIYTPMQLFSLTGRFEHLLTQQQVITSSNTTTDNIFQQIKYTAGIIFRPFGAVEIEEAFTVKSLAQTGVSDASQSQSGMGYSNLIRLGYKPLQSENFKVLMEYSVEANWGLGFNDLERIAARQGTNEFAPLLVRPRNDMVMSGGFNVNIALSLPQFPQIEKLLITGEGAIKRVIDKLNPANNYDITGFYLGIKALF